MSNGPVPQQPPPVVPPQTGPSAAGLVATFVAVLTGPTAFFESRKSETGMGGPVVFALVMGLVSGVLAAVYALVGLTAAAGAAGGVIGAVAGFGAIVMYPVLAVIGVFIGGAIVHLVAMIAGGKGTYEHSVRIAGYAAAVMPIGVLISFVPLVRMVPSLYGLYIVALGVIALHLADRQKTFMAVGVLAALMVLFSVGAWFAGRAAHSAAAELQAKYGEGSQFQRDLMKAAEEARKAAEEARKAK